MVAHPVQIVLMASDTVAVAERDDILVPSDCVGRSVSYIVAVASDIVVVPQDEVVAAPDPVLQSLQSVL